MREILNAMRAQAAAVGGDTAMVRNGTVTSYNPANYAVKVMIEPEGTETGWLPVLSPWIGNGWGMFAPPTIGDAIEVHFTEGDFEAGFACLRYFNDSDRPLSVQSGEFWLVHSSGSFFKLKNDGKVLINGNVEIDATAPTINITATGNITAQAGGNATVQAAGAATISAPSIILKNAGAALKKLCTEVFMALYNGHTHTSNTVGSPTSTPIQQASAGTHTTNIVQAE